MKPPSKFPAWRFFLYLLLAALSLAFISRRLDAMNRENVREFLTAEQRRAVHDRCIAAASRASTPDDVARLKADVDAELALLELRRATLEAAGPDPR